MTLNNITNTAFADEYNIDKIVGVYTGSFSPNTSQTTTLGGYLYQYAIPHSFTRPVFTELLWSVDNVTFIDGGSASGPSGVQTLAYSDSNNLYILTGAMSGTIYYKLIASWIDDYDNTNPSITPVLNTTQDRIFDSSNNYQKIIYSGILTALTSAPSPSSYLTAIQVPLAPSFPNAKMYMESLPGQVWPSIGGGTQDYFKYDTAHQWEGFLWVTYTPGTPNIPTIEIYGQAGISASSCRFWYRVYGDTQ